MKTDYAGIDYGMGKSNIDHDTGIRYGVINQNEVLQAWADESEADYGEPTCPKCGNEAKDYSDFVNEVLDGDDSQTDNWEFAEHECDDYVCPDCQYIFGSESAFPDEPYSFHYINDEYKAFQSHDDTDIFIEKSPYYTWCQFCSPCAPGAGYLMNYTDKSVGIKAYCFGHGWFWDTDSKRAPYPVYRVDDDTIVEAV